MAEELPKVYEGDRPYIFVSYAHADRLAALPIIAALVAEGYRVWYDDGIELAEDYPEYIANHVYGCSCFVMLISSSALSSKWCKKEADYAIDLDKSFLPIYLQDVELPRGLQMGMGRRQAMFWYEFDSNEAFYRKLFKARRLEPCLTPEGKERRGVKPRGDGSKTAQEAKATGPVPDEPHAAEHQVARTKAAEPQADELRAARSGGVDDINRQVDSGFDFGGVPGGGGVPVGRRGGVARSGRVDGIEPKGGLADYSWAQLKEISQLIAAAGSDVSGLMIAKRYNLVDEGGRLRGETKAVTLKDGTRTSVRVLGFRHDDLAGGGKAGISFEFADVPAEHRMNPDWDNEGGWEASEMCGWLNDGKGGFLSLLPDDLRPLVETSAKRTNNRGEVPWGDTTSVTETRDKLWLLSMSEVYGKLSAQEKSVPWSPATYDAEGEQYQLYADGGVSTSSYGFCRKRGADSWWWLRSPYASDAHGFHLVYDGGDWDWFVSADLEWGVSPGFCF